MLNHCFTLYGRVRGQGRPRFGNGRAYKAEADRRYEALVRSAYEESGGPVFNGPVEVAIGIFRKLPSNRPKSCESEPDVTKPDADNVAKAILDALNGVAWEDDAQVVELHVRKWPRKRIDEERVSVRIWEATS